MHFAQSKLVLPQDVPTKYEVATRSRDLAIIPCTRSFASTLSPLSLTEDDSRVRQAVDFHANDRMAADILALNFKANISTI